MGIGFVAGAWLAAQEVPGSVSVVDARAERAYRELHLPGAVNLDVSTLSYADSSSAGQARLLARVGEQLRAGGVAAARPVVFYEDGTGYYAGFAAWLAAALGHPRVSILDGGLTGWLRSGRHGSGDTERVEPAGPWAEPDPTAIASLADVLAAIRDPDVQILDVRAHKERSGAWQRTARSGGIPGSLHVPWTENVRAHQLEDLEVLARLYRTTGLDPARQVIVYCHAGWRASHTAIVLGALGFGRVRTYLGSWEEWGNDPSVPVEDAPASRDHSILTTHEPTLETR